MKLSLKNIMASSSSSKAKSMSIPRTRGTSASPSNHQFVYASDRKARTLGAKSVLKSSGSGIEEASIDNGTTNAKNAAREADRLNNILGNLSIK